MEIRQVLRGTNTSFAAPKTKAAEQETSAQPADDRLELSQQWIGQMQEQSARLQALWTQPKDKKSNGILDMLDEPGEGSQEADQLAKELDTKMKCLKIAANIMKGKKVPPQDERYLMENDPEGYKLAIAMRSMVKEDKKKCKSVLDDEDKEETSETEASGEAASVESSDSAEAAE